MRLLIFLAILGTVSGAQAEDVSYTGVLGQSFAYPAVPGNNRPAKTYSYRLAKESKILFPEYQNRDGQTIVDLEGATPEVNNLLKMLVFNANVSMPSPIDLKEGLVKLHGKHDQEAKPGLLVDSVELQSIRPIRAVYFPKEKKFYDFSSNSSNKEAKSGFELDLTAPKAVQDILDKESKGREFAIFNLWIQSENGKLQIRGARSALSVFTWKVTGTLKKSKLEGFSSLCSNFYLETKEKKFFLNVLTDGQLEELRKASEKEVEVELVLANQFYFNDLMNPTFEQEVIGGSKCSLISSIKVK